MRAMLGRTGLYVMTKGTVSVRLFGFGFKSVVARNVRSPFYLGFEKVISPFDEAVFESA